MWTLKQGEVQRRRIACGFNVQQLADKSGLDRKTIERVERGDRLRMRHENILNLAAALKCRPEEIAVNEEAAAKLDPWTGPPMTSPALSMMGTGPDTKQAQRETAMGISRPYLVWGDKEVPILSFHKKKQCEMVYATLQGDTLAVCGKIRHYDTMPRHVAEVLKADVGAGAGFFIIQREIKGLGPQGGSEFLRTVVYVPSQKHALDLMAYHDNASEVTVLVRLVVREPSEEWLGFPTLDSETSWRPWAFVSQWVTRRGDLPEHNIEPQRK